MKDARMEAFDGNVDALGLASMGNDPWQSAVWDSLCKANGGTSCW